jgi:hypothetical protein
VAITIAIMGPPMTSTDALSHRPRTIKKSELPGRVVLVMQGGGAPASYQAGANQALHEAGIEPTHGRIDRRSYRRLSDLWSAD